MKKRNNILIASAVGLMSILVVSCQKDELTAPLQVTNADNNTVVRTFDKAHVLDRATPYTLSGIEDTWDKAYQNEDGTLSSRTVPSLTGTWKLIRLNGRPIEVQQAENPYIRIGSELSGFSGCNQITGSVFVEGAYISFMNIRDPRRHCPTVNEIEKHFIYALRSAISFTLQVDLLRLSNDRNEVAILQRVYTQPPTPIGSTDH